MIIGAKQSSPLALSLLLSTPPFLVLLSLNVSGQTRSHMRGNKNTKHFISMVYDDGQDAGTGKSSRDKRELGLGRVFVTSIGQSVYASRGTAALLAPVPRQLHGFCRTADCKSLLINDLRRQALSPESLLHQWAPKGVAKTIAAPRKIITNTVMVANQAYDYHISDNSC